MDHFIAFETVPLKRLIPEMCIRCLRSKLSDGKYSRLPQNLWLLGWYFTPQEEELWTAIKYTKSTAAPWSSIALWGGIYKRFSRLESNAILLVNSRHVSTLVEFADNLCPHRLLGIMLSHFFPTFQWTDFIQQLCEEVDSMRASSRNWAQINCKSKQLQEVKTTIKNGYYSISSRFVGQGNLPLMLL